MANINKNIIMQAGAAVANAANKAAVLPAATPEPGSIISVIQLVNGGRTIGPDALAHFTESVRNKLLSLLVAMEPIQDFNGYGHPWPAGGNYNICDGIWEEGEISGSTGNNQSSTTYYRTANYIPIQPETDYYVVAENISGVARARFYASDNTFIGTTDYNGGQVQLNKAFKSPSNAYYVRFAESKQLIPNPETTFGLNYPATVKTWTPYANICPLSGRTGMNVYAGPTDSIGDATTYSMVWTSPAGTVYAGSADIVSGDIKAAPYYASYNGETLVGPWVSSMDVYDPEGTPTTGAQVVDLGGTMTEYHITGQDIITLVGDNYIWSDSGDVTIKE